jgi:hypothetical protein
MYINQIRLWKKGVEKGIVSHSAIRAGEYFMIVSMEYSVAYPYCTIRYLSDSKTETVFLKRIDEDSFNTED